jgi:hypothetical protein
VTWRFNGAGPAAAVLQGVAGELAGDAAVKALKRL